MISLKFGGCLTLESNFPCKCGHPKDMHQEKWDWADGASVCMISNESPKYHLCIYIPDNLRFLEQEYVRNNK